MVYGLLITLFLIVCAFLVLLILIQKGKGSTGLGSLGGSTQMLFGGSGGQDIFQKITWALIAIFLFGSLILALMKSSGSRQVRYERQQSSAAQQPVSSPTEELPVDAE